VFVTFVRQGGGRSSSCNNIPLRNLLVLLDFTSLWLHAARQKAKVFCVAMLLE
jgi:hypothetical protein